MKRVKKPSKTKKPSAPAKRQKAKRARRAGSSFAQGLLVKLRAVCLALPEATEVEAWGHPTFRVNDKIFAGFGGDDAGCSMSVKCTHDMQAALVSSDPRFTVAAYVGKHGWVSLDLPPGAKLDWNEIEVLVRQSYLLVAPTKLARALAD